MEASGTINYYETPWWAVLIGITGIVDYWNSERKECDAIREKFKPVEEAINKAISLKERNR